MVLKRALRRAFESDSLGARTFLSAERPIIPIRLVFAHACGQKCRAPGQLRDTAPLEVTAEGLKFFLTEMARLELAQGNHRVL
jgi:hypothetical protein